MGEVVDLELEVWGHVGGLDGREVGRDDGDRGVLVCEVDGPDSGTGSQIEDALGVRRNGCQEEKATEGQSEDVVEEIEVILCGLVVGPPVARVSVPGLQRGGGANWRTSGCLAGRNGACDHSERRTL